MLEKIIQRLTTTLANIEFQGNQAYWDDIEKLQEVIEQLEVINKKYLLAPGHYCYNEPDCDVCKLKVTV